MREAAALTERLPAEGLPLLLPQQADRVELDRGCVSSLLANMFLGTVTTQDVPGVDFPSPSFLPLLVQTEMQELAKQVQLSKQKTINDSVSHQSEAF